ncbi:MAG: hypothetical protein OSB41_04530 [Kiritimatiellae bacterium]|nr:hypothetical protein [Kiritimatiellia bacterium]
MKITTHIATFIAACFIGSGLKLKGNVKVVADELSSYVAGKVRKETGGWQKTVLGYI